MKTTFVALACWVFPTIANAQSEAPPTPSTAVSPATAATPASVAAPQTASSIEDKPQVRIGPELVLLPVGSITAGTDMLSVSESTAFAVGFGAIVQFPVHRNVAFEIAPRMLLNVKGSEAPESARELDLRLRLVAGGSIFPGIRLYGAIAPGYSLIHIPDLEEPVGDPSGPTLGFGVGAAVQVDSGVSLTTELGYQFGFQSTEVLGTDVDFKTRYLSFAGGVLVDL